MQIRSSVISSLQQQTKVSSLATSLLEKALLFSPRTWYGILENFHTLGKVDLSTIVQSLSGFLLAWMVVKLGFHLGFPNRSSSATGVLLVFLLSPWSVASSWTFLWQPLSLLITTIIGRKALQSQTLESADECLSQRLQQHRAYQTRRFNVFLPVNDNDDSPRQAILLLPGAYVSHTAYSELAALLSDEGFVVVVVSMEPMRLTSYHLGADPKSMQKIMNRVESQLSLLLSERSLKGVDPLSPSISSWTLMGHSMGALTAMKLICSHNNSNRSTTTNLSNRLVLIGIAPFFQFASDLSSSSPSCSVLKVQATHDSIVQNCPPAWQATFDAYFPSNRNSQTEFIQGGTHHGFASYKTRFGGDGTPQEISYSKQQQQTCQIITDFLKRTQ